MTAKGNLVVGQSGGPTSVINQSLIGVVREALKHDIIGEIYGASNGVLGILNENFIDFRQEDHSNLEGIAKTPSSALGTCRHKPSEEDCEKILTVFSRYNVHYFFYIGGNDSAETADIINSIARERHYDLHIIHIPKTIDNDLRETDHCPGYGSAATYVALSFIGNNLDNRALPGIKIDVVMGRNAGWLTAAASLGKKFEDDGPHLLYFPERPVSLDRFCQDVGNIYEKYGRALIAVSEGIRNVDGKLMLESQITEVDTHGNVQLSGSGALGDFLTSQIKEKLKNRFGQELRVRADTLGYAQRCFPTVNSEVDAREARMVGEAAVKFAMQGEKEGSIAIRRILEQKEYTSEADLVELKKVAKVTRPLEDEFINVSGNDVTPQFKDYALPLIGKLPEISRLEEKKAATR